MLQPGDKILTMSLQDGGHLTHGHPKNCSGMLYNVVNYGVNPETGYIDYDEIEDAQWFSINELKSLQHPSISGGFKLPRVDSIARRLVDTWINSFN